MRVIREPRVLLVASVGISGFMLVHGLNNWLPEILAAKGYSTAAAGVVATAPRFSGVAAGLIGAQVAVLMGSRVRAASAALAMLSLGPLLVLGRSSDHR